MTSWHSYIKGGGGHNILVLHWVSILISSIMWRTMVVDFSVKKLCLEDCSCFNIFMSSRFLRCFSLCMADQCLFAHIAKDKVLLTGQTTCLLFIPLDMCRAVMKQFLLQSRCIETCPLWRIHLQDRPCRWRLKSPASRLFTQPFI